MEKQLIDDQTANRNSIQQLIDRQTADQTAYRNSIQQLIDDQTANRNSIN